MLTIEQQIQELAIANSWTVSLAESCTGGAIAARLTRVSGASAYFLGGIVSYSNELKETILHVSSDALELHGAVSEEIVSQMVQGVLNLTGSSFALAVTGIAGPTGGSPSKPVGTVWIAVGGGQGALQTKQLCLAGERSAIIDQAVTAALQLLLTQMHS